jgi:hypothetical protein
MGHINVPMDENMIAATLISLEHTINHCTRTRDEINAFVMARQAVESVPVVDSLTPEIMAAASLVERHMTDLDPAVGGTNNV